MSLLPPTLSVIMSVYNGEVKLSESIDSILNQTYTDFEFIIINDGSTDNTKSILDDYASKDPRIKIFHQANQGLTRSLIDGCQLAKGKYIARMDAGDISYPERFRIQVALLDSNQELGMVYCGADFYGPFGELLYNETRSSDPVIAHLEVLHQKLGPPGHPTVMMRKLIYDQAGGYRPDFYYSQDSDLWLRIAEISQVCSTKETLLRIQLDLNGISANRKIIQYQFADLGHKAKDLRLKGETDQPVLWEAFKLTENMNRFIYKYKSNSRRDYAGHLYFLGSLCTKKYPDLANKYFSMAVQNRPFNIKYIYRWLVSYAMTFNRTYKPYETTH